MDPSLCTLIMPQRLRSQLLFWMLYTTITKLTILMYTAVFISSGHQFITIFFFLKFTISITKTRCFNFVCRYSQFSAKATDAYELARKKVATFINASDSREIVFTRNATEAINLVAYSWGLVNLKPGDEVLFSDYTWFMLKALCENSFVINQ